ncbi:hypothetical protein [Lactiplantibacillus carotarum]|uniref:hypothetical protein n=1 Tax=Lactiplantibacillus carotarum TaxID=2993456 RepID=UPI00298F285A|nr:hypothetical protein [Lactiplantibacillus carotarum]
MVSCKNGDVDDQKNGNGLWFGATWLLNQSISNQSGTGTQLVGLGVVPFHWLLVSGAGAVSVTTATGRDSGMESYEPPYVKQLTDPEKQAPREPVTAPVTLGAVIHEVGGFGLLQVCLKRWGLFVVALPWIAGIGIKQIRKA